MHRILVIGTGSIGERHARCFLTTGRATVGIVETNPALRDEIARKYSIVDAYNSVEAALAHKWDLAVIATPAPAHMPIAVQLAAHEVNLLIEKPVSLKFDDIGPLQDLLRQRSLVVGIGYVWRVHPLL